jgi:valyl-tRNA synthetase
MDKQYYPVEIEEKWSKIWSERVISNKDSDTSFSQVIPPPNVTGTLHMGHSFQYAIWISILDITIWLEKMPIGKLVPIMQA